MEINIEPFGQNILSTLIGTVAGFLLSIALFSIQQRLSDDKVEKNILI